MSRLARTAPQKFINWQHLFTDRGAFLQPWFFTEGPRNTPNPPPPLVFLRQMRFPIRFPGCLQTCKRVSCAALGLGGAGRGLFRGQPRGARGGGRVGLSHGIRKMGGVSWFGLQNEPSKGRPLHSQPGWCHVACLQRGLSLITCLLSHHFSTEQGALTPN